MLDKIDLMLNTLWTEHGAFLLVFVPLFLAIYFLPSLIAVLLRREHKKKIMLANIPAGFSWIAWVGILIWAVSGKQEEEGC
ncbi:superinfection immunity protein [Pseudoteredinibacter isoporae]|uniref:Na+/proline symporter n=1 Tax=Pseudoteredinibacter isoporae TaxID=570281 RepID=A0A7X0MUH0_9GAMM|nr:superinfection immunity protein [Pseudoteredinibacter isoporae]MBB6520621.1 Na+/proline symporter [Pseudoteredinibacter isoporae]NHO86188.1 superinfection immunity protein [Pseudoteredinibacter isoporae]NIB25361.1 superinfection immunity protein [Pseudoteredinibacter isoporae]